MSQAATQPTETAGQRSCSDHRVTGAAPARWPDPGSARTSRL